MIAELEKQGHEVINLDRDVRDRRTMLGLRDFDVIYHLAGVLGTSELNNRAYEASETNILGTINMLDAAKRCGAKFIDITKPNVWLNTYSITKYAGEQFTKMYHKEFGLPAVSIKWFNVYGPRQSFHCQKAVPFFIRWALNDEDIEIWGDGTQTGDFIHAKDAVKATIAVAGHKNMEGQTIDIGSGEETTVNELAEMIIKLTGSKSKIVHRPMRSGEDEHTHLKADIRPILGLGYTPEYDLETGLKETIEYYASRK